MRKKIPFTILILILLGVFGYSAWQVGSYVLESREQKKKYDQLAAMVEQVQATATTCAVTDAPSAPDVPSEPAAPEETTPAEEEQEEPILPEYEALYHLNDDLVGWLKIDGTYINYPVMQTPMVPEYYLRRNFYHENSQQGCLFAEEDCDIEKPSDNVTIYGHCMKDGSMFAGLSNYTSKSYWESHSTVHFDTLRERRTYTVFAVFKTSAEPGQGFSYHTFIDAADAEGFDAYVAKCKELSIIDTGITPEYGDKLLCLSTCEYTMANGRLVVVAVLDTEAEA